MRSPGSIYVACRYRRASRLVVLWQQFKRVDMARPDDSEVAAVERGDPSHAHGVRRRRSRMRPSRRAAGQHRC
jgi:hypothetical protein